MTALWGTSAWGLDNWGIDLGLSGLSAVAVTDHSIVVHFGDPPLQQSEIGDGDALNPLTWTVTSNGRNLTPMTVSRIAADEFEVVLFDALDPYQRDVVIGSTTLRSLVGDTFDPFEVTVAGVHQPPVDRNVALDLVDVANPFFVDGQPASHMRVLASGDYASESGSDLIRKLVIRMLITRPGEFFDAVEFGFGLQVKDAISAPALTQLRLDVERAVSGMPGVLSVGVRLTLDSNALTIEVKAKTGSGSVTAVIPIPTGPGAQF